MATRGKAKGKTTQLIGSWELIEAQFVKGLIQDTGEIYYPTVPEIADAHGIPYTTVRSRMLNGRWMMKRDEWQRTVQKWTHAANMQDYIEAAQKFDATCVRAAQLAMDNIVKHLEVFQADGEIVPQYDLERMGRAAVSWQRVGRLSLGLSTENNLSKYQEMETQQVQIDTELLTEREQQIIDTFIENIEKRRPQIETKVELNEE